MDGRFYNAIWLRCLYKAGLRLVCIIRVNSDVPYLRWKQSPIIFNSRKTRQLFTYFYNSGLCGIKGPLPINKHRNKRRCEFYSFSVYACFSFVFLYGSVVQQGTVSEIHSLHVPPRTASLSLLLSARLAWGWRDCLCPLHHAFFCDVISVGMWCFVIFAATPITTTGRAKSGQTGYINSISIRLNYQAIVLPIKTGFPCLW